MKDIYVKFGKPDIKGESRDAEHKDWVEVSSWTHEIRQPKSATSSSAGGHTAERVEHGDMVFGKEMDSVSPLLYQHASAGTTFDEVEIEFFRASGDKRIKYLVVKLKNVLISSVKPSVAGEGIPTESFSLTYAAVSWNYTVQSVDGKQGGTTAGNWSLSKNQASYAA
jgi:type VI secretion system secreted protein Hcp